jgi:recombination protein RecA
MAKKAAAIEIDLNPSEDLINSLMEEYGDICYDAEDLCNDPKKIISVSPSIDLILHGGIPESSTVLCSGPHSCGKTTLALWFAANCQKTGRHVYYLDVEHRLKPMNLKGIPHLKFDKENFTVVRSHKGAILTAEQFISVILKILNTHPDSLIIVDSASALCSAKELTNEEVKSEMRNEGPKLLASLCRRMSGTINVNNNILFMIQHLIANTSGYGKAFNTDGGNKIQYAADVKINGKGAQQIKIGTDPDPIGQKVTWQCEKSALGNHGRQWDGVIRYGQGIDIGGELVSIAEQTGAVKKSGAWYSIECIENHLEEFGLTEWNDETKKLFKYQGFDKISQALNADEKLYNVIYKDVMPKV